MKMVDNRKKRNEPLPFCSWQLFFPLPELPPCVIITIFPIKEQNNRN